MRWHRCLKDVPEKDHYHRGESLYALSLIPGIFEHLLRTDEADALHIAYAELINDLVETGYLGDYFSRPVNAIRNIPVQRTVEAKSFIADSDLVSELIDSR